jgi:hypothetical protein
MFTFLLLLFLTVVSLVAAISVLHLYNIPDRFVSPTTILAGAYDLSREGSKRFLFSLGETGIGISVLILLFLVGGMEA